MTDLPTRKLGRTGVDVSVLGFGAMELRGAPRGPDISDQEAERENSLRLLKTDHLDLVQFHRSLTCEEFERDGALQEAIKLKEEGKVRFLGVSGTLPNLDEQIGLGVFDAFQIPYSVLQANTRL